MILYHGSNIEIGEILLSKGRHGKDFGRGFYLSADYMREGSGTPIVTKFEFDESSLDGFNVKLFEGYTEEWAKFVLANRKNRSDEQVHQYDIVIGPIADDAVGVQIRQLSRGFITFDKFLESIKYTTPTCQYFFGTEGAIRLLTKI